MLATNELEQPLLPAADRSHRFAIHLFPHHYVGKIRWDYEELCLHDHWGSDRDFWPQNENRKQQG